MQVSDKIDLCPILGEVYLQYTYREGERKVGEGRKRIKARKGERGMLYQEGVCRILQNSMCREQFAFQLSNKKAKNNQLKIFRNEHFQSEELRAQNSKRDIQIHYMGYNIPSLMPIPF